MFVQGSRTETSLCHADRLASPVSDAAVDPGKSVRGTFYTPHRWRIVRTSTPVEYGPLANRSSNGK
jgi:hypothetical protein